MEITYIKTTESNLNSVPIVDGQILYTSDTSKQYSDFNGVRTRIPSGQEVSANTGAIEAIVNRYGSKNLADIKSISGAKELTWTLNSDKTVTTLGTLTARTYDQVNSNNFILKAGTYILSKNPSPSATYPKTGISVIKSDLSVSYCDLIEDEEKEFTLSADTEVKLYFSCSGQGSTFDLTFYPMIRDARITDPTYVPYAMTNRELTDKVASMLPPITSFAANGTVMFVNASDKWGIFLPLPFIVDSSWTFSFSNIQIVYKTLLTYHSYVVRNNGVIVLVTEDLSVFVNREGYAQITISV